MMCPEARKQGGVSKRNPSRDPREPVYIEHLVDLEPHTDEIVEQFSANKRLALLAAADPVGVLGEFGYRLSRQAADELLHSLPRMSREGRDRYLAWLRDLDPVPDTVSIRLVHRPSGRQLLQRPVERGQPLPDNRGPTGAGGAAGFDIVAQFGQGLCKRMLKRHYADGKLPRSIYRVGGKLHSFLHAGHYEDFRRYIGDADREVHFGECSLQFLASKSDRVRVSSAFVAKGFTSEPLKGSVAVDAMLVLRKDAKGHSQYIEAAFNALKEADVAVSISTAAGATAPSAAVQAELRKTVHQAYKDFRQLSKPEEPHTPLTFTLINSDELTAKGAKPKPGEVKFAVMQPTEASSPLLVVAFNRFERKGSGQLGAVPNYIKTGGDFAFVQDRGWLEQAMNAGFAKALPVRFDPDTGIPDEQGDLRLDSIVWHYREDGITADLTALYEDWFLWVDKEVKGQMHTDITFHSSEPHVEIVGYSDLKGMSCWEKVFFVILMTLFGAVLGGVAGAIVGGIAGGLAVGALIGVVAGAFGGCLGALYLIGMLPTKFGTGGGPAKAQQQLKHKVKVTHEQALPEASGTVKVVPNDLKISKQGTAMSAKTIGPAYAAVEPWVRIGGSHSVSITPPQPGPSQAPSAEEKEAEGTLLFAPVGSAEQLVSPRADWALGQAGSGIVSLHYQVVNTYGLQGVVSYEWLWNGKAIGAAKKIDVDVPLDSKTLATLQYGQVNYLGVLKLKATDSFGRNAVDQVQVTVGVAKNLRAFKPLIARVPGVLDRVVDPLEQVKRPGELINQVGWLQEATGLVQSQGILVSQTTFASPVTGETLAVVATAPEITV
jgi:hypothetical protein